jgi:hypothetical protein
MWHNFAEIYGIECIIWRVWILLMHVYTPEEGFVNIYVQYSDAVWSKEIEILILK